VINKGLQVIAIVPARGGSKGVPRKNIKKLAGEPLIGYTLRAAKSVKEIDRLVVSTDNEDISSIAQSYGVEVIMRPPELATDNASTESALIHVIEKLTEKGDNYDIILVLEPTSPFRSSSTIRNAINHFSDNNTESVLAVRKSNENIGTIRNGLFFPLMPEAPRRRQLRDPQYIESSTIYAVRTDYLKKNKTLVSEKWTALIVPDYEAIDINTEGDFQYAEYNIKQNNINKDV
jgi:CMP-N-acetylneuraminic acid synthetase